MLTWRRVNDHWRGNGFLIEHPSPHEWHLFDASVLGTNSTIVADPAPIASLPTLSAAKYKAEHLHQETELAILRRRLGAVAAGFGSLAVLSSSAPVVAIVFSVIAGAAALELITTWFESRVGGARQVMQ